MKIARIAGDERRFDVKNKSADVHLMRLNQIAFSMPASTEPAHTLHNAQSLAFKSNILHYKQYLVAYTRVQTSESFGGP